MKEELEANMKAYRIILNKRKSSDNCKLMLGPNLESASMKLPLFSFLSKKLTVESRRKGFGFSLKEDT